MDTVQLYLIVQHINLLRTTLSQPLQIYNHWQWPHLLDWLETKDAITGGHLGHLKRHILKPGVNWLNQNGTDADEAKTELSGKEELVITLSEFLIPIGPFLNSFFPRHYAGFSCGYATFSP